MISSFGTDIVRRKQAMLQIVIADLTEEHGIKLLMQSLSNPYVVGIFLAPPCGSAIRVRSIPLKGKHPGDPPALRPLRSNEYSNGLRFLSFVDKMKISKANKLYQLTAKLIRWASRRLFVLRGEFSVQLVLADNIYARCFAPPAVHHFSNLQVWQHKAKTDHVGI